MKDIIFFKSRNCDYSIQFLNMLQQAPWAESLTFIDVAKPENKRLIELFEIKYTPTIIINGNKYVGKKAFQWLDYQLNPNQQESQSRSHPQQPQIQEMSPAALPQMTQRNKQSRPIETKEDEPLNLGTMNDNGGGAGFASFSAESFGPITDVSHSSQGGLTNVPEVTRNKDSISDYDNSVKMEQEKRKLEQEAIARQFENQRMVPSGTMRRG